VTQRIASGRTIVSYPHMELRRACGLFAFAVAGCSASPADAPKSFPASDVSTASQGARAGRTSGSEREGAPPLASAAATFEAPGVDEEVLVPSTHACHATVRNDVLRLRCERAKGDGPGLIDIANTDPSVVGGRFEITDTELIWTVSSVDEKHNPFFFDDGAWELSIRTADHRREWLLDGTYKPGGEAKLRHTMACCLANEKPEACMGRGLESEASACEHEKACAAFDACIQKRVQSQRSNH